MNVNEPLVSIVSPTYNHATYIADCIESVLKQTYSNWEMIIIDDGSTDGTFAVAQEYTKKDNRIQAYTQKNIGIFRLGESYNFALSKCKGKYVAILECDDVWLPEKLSVQVNVLEKRPECVLSWGKAYLSSIDLSQNYYLAPQILDNIQLFDNKPVGSFLKTYIYSISIPALTILIKKDALDAIGGFIQKFNLPLVDIPTTIELMLRGEFAYINEPLGKWRIYPNQVTKTYTSEISYGFYLLVQDSMHQKQELFEQLGITKKEIDNYFAKRLVVSYSRSGRYKLIRKDFKGARKDYLFSITHFGLHKPVWKLRSRIGLFMSLFHGDVEWLATLIGNTSYK